MSENAYLSLPPDAPLFGSLSDNFATANTLAVVGYSEAHCTLLPFFTDTVPYSSGYTYKDIILIASAVTTVFTLIFTVSLSCVHLSHWVKPKEQKQLVRIILFPTVFAFFNLYAVWFYERAWVLTPFPELYECFAIVAMLYLIVVYVSPHDATREEQFHHLQRLYQRFGKKRGTPKHGKGSLRWFQLTWVMVFQMLPVKLVVNFLTWGLSSAMCPLSYQLSHASLAIEVIQSVSTSIGITYIILFATRVAADLQGTGTRSKLWSFKTIVGISLTQTPVFDFIAVYSSFHRNIHVSVLDFTVGTPSFMTCCEMCITSIVFLWTFSAEPYLNLTRDLPRCNSVGGAFLEVLDVRDILKGLWYMVKIITCTAGRQGAMDMHEDVERDGHEMMKGQGTSGSD